jgi:hypothetical protein
MDCRTGAHSSSQDLGRRDPAVFGAESLPPFTAVKGEWDGSKP